MLAEMLGGLGGAALGAVSDTLSAPRRYLMQSLGLPETGADLIAHTTGLNTEDMGLAGHALNFGAEALTDPLTLGGGALTRLLGKGLTAGRSAYSALKASRGQFAMAKGVIPREIEQARELARIYPSPTADKLLQKFNMPDPRVVGGGASEKTNALGVVKAALQDNSGTTAGMYVPGRNAGAALHPQFGLEQAARHETIHGIIDQAAKSGDTSGLPLLMKMPALLKQGTRAGDNTFRAGAGRVMDELAAQTLENRGLGEQMRGAAQFLLPMKVDKELTPLARLLGGNDFLPHYEGYANSFAKTSPTAAALYRYAGPAAALLGSYGAIGGGMKAAGLLE